MSRYTVEHIGIAVRSLDEALGFYREQLGMAVSAIETVEAEKVRVAMLPAGESRIELLEATAEDSPIARFLARRGEGLHHIALRVENLGAVLKRLKAAGVRLISTESGRGAGGHRYAFVHPESAGGVLLELVEEETRDKRKKGA